jgi:hypothetical protein
MIYYIGSRLLLIYIKIRAFLNIGESPQQLVRFNGKTITGDERPGTVNRNPQ